MAKVLKPGSLFPGTTVTVEAVILGGIRQGGYPHVAAQAAGVEPHLFDDWMHWGTARGSKNKPYREFRSKVLQAQAQARLKAEHAIFSTRPDKWLLLGPGKERTGSPGWSAQAKPVLTSQTQINLLASPEWNGLWSTILGTLSEFPEARAALVEAVTVLDGTPGGG